MPKSKQKLFSDDPIIDNSEDEEPDEYQRIVREAEQKRELKKRPKSHLKAEALIP